MVTKQRNGQGLYTPNKIDRRLAELKSTINCSFAHMEYIDDGRKIIADVACGYKTRCRKFNVCRENLQMVERNTYGIY